MNSLDGITGSRWKTLTQRLSFKGLGCCGAKWSPGSTPAMTILQPRQGGGGGGGGGGDGRPISDNQVTSGSTDGHLSVGHGGMNLAMALARERDSRAGSEEDGAAGPPTMSLMRLIEETDGVDLAEEDASGDHKEGRENDWVCCVCMEGSKGAAFIPCGHAFCRVCSRELWVNRRSCPICNRSILDVLDIF